MNFHQNDSTYRGTGFLISPYAVLTAAHVVYDSVTSSWSTNIKVVPGQYENPFSILKPYGEKSYYTQATNTAYIKTGDFEHDYGVIKIRSPFAGISTYMPLKFGFDIDNNYTELNISGYHSTVNGITQYGQWFASGFSSNYTTTQKAYYSLDTTSGSSGSPVWLYDPDTDSHYVVAIHAFEEPGRSVNGGPRLTRSNQSLIEEWASWAPDNSSTDDVTLKAVINTVEAGNINAVWQKGGEDTTSRGDRVVWGYFYADPNDVSWGSINNPEVFVKIWYDAGGRVDANFFHVSVPDIEVSATYNGVDLKAIATTSKRYVRHYYNDNNSDGTSVNLEDGIPAAGYHPANNPFSYSITSNLNIGATINTDEAVGSIDALWRLGGNDTTYRGDRVVWGHLYADPNDVSWGSKNNPELFVKIWFDLSGRIDVNYFHVSVPEIEVYSGYNLDGFYDNKGTTIMDDRYIRHEYTKE